MSARLTAVLLASSAVANADYRGVALPLLEQYCLDCHSQDAKKGELDLERFRTLADLRADAEVWQNVLHQIEVGEMPPKDKAQPSPDERSRLLAWTRAFLDDEALRRAGDPGPTVLRRLNNAEYSYTLRDLTGVESLEPAREFPADGAAGEGFTNAAAALSMSPALVEKFLDAGKDVAAHAVLLPDGFRFEPGTTRRDWTNAIIDQIRAIYLRHTGGGGIDFSYRAQVGNVAPESAAEGKLDTEPYFAALRAGDAGVLNGKYLTLLRAEMEKPVSGNVLLDQLRSDWGEGAKAETLAAEVRGWQAALWKFNKVGHFGLTRPWQGEVDPVRAGRVPVRKPVAGGQGRLFLTAAGDAATRWANPRFVKAGHEPLPLDALAWAGEQFVALRDRELPRTAEYLAVLEAARKGEAVAIDAVAERDNLDPRLLRAWFALGGVDGGFEIGEYLTHFAERPGTPEIGSWTIPGIGDLSLAANKGSADWNIPGTMRAGKIAVHPRPERPLVVAWRSPIDGEVTIGGEVIDAHHTCGNGVRWSLASRRANTRRALAEGDVDLGKGGPIPKVERHAVRKGDLISLEIDARDRSHVCDLTQIDLTIEGGGKRWSLSEDCAATLGAGNPHADQFGNSAVWHFYSPPGNAAKATPIPEGSALAKWLSTGNSDAADQLVAALTGKADDPMSASLRSPGGPLFGAIDWAAGAEFANEALTLEPGEVREIGLPAGLVDGWEFVADGEAAGAGGAQFVISATPLPAGAGLSPGQIVVADEAAAATWRADFDEFRALFPIAVSYTRVVPIDEVVTLLLFHREDEAICRLMLSDAEIEDLDRLWDELIYVSGEPLRLVTAYEQLWQFATQDGDPKSFEPFEEQIRERAAAFEERLIECEPAQLDALVRFAKRAYRGAFVAEDGEALRTLYQKLRDEEIPHDEAFRLLLARVFSSPKFLFKAEEPVVTGTPSPKSAPVVPEALASRLSYFLWSSMPDDELLEATTSGDLEGQLERMLRDPRARRIAEEFACSWLGVRDFDELDEKSETLYPEFASLRGAMHEEVIGFFADLFANDRSVLSIIDADHSFVPTELATFYGIEGGGGRVDGMRERGRGGVLGMAATLAKQSGASRTSPILRGNWVYEVLLGNDLPDPPADIPQLPDLPPEGLTERQLIARHSSAPECARCHEKIDPYGFALEGFDTIGRARPAADTAAVLPDGAEIDGLSGLRSYLLERRREEFLRQFCRKLLGYALGRGVLLSDKPLIDEMVASLEAEGYRSHVALERIVASRQFREIRIPPDQP